MTSNQFYIKKIPEGGDRFSLEGDELHHLCHVARIKVGEQIWLTDGSKRRLLAEVEIMAKDKIWLRPLCSAEENLNTEIIVGFGLTKPATSDFIIQKATELGVSRIQPLITQRSMFLSPDKIQGRAERWQRIAREALKQSKGAVLPLISQPLKLKPALSQISAEARFYLEGSSSAYFRDILENDRPSSVCLLCGPEGGWTEEEEAMMKKAGYRGLSLGGRVLRTETAVISALSLISHFWNW